MPRSSSLALLLLAAPAFAQATPAGWQRYDSPDGRFAASFPKKPKADTQKQGHGFRELLAHRVGVALGPHLSLTLIHWDVSPEDKFSLAFGPGADLTKPLTEGDPEIIIGLIETQLDDETYKPHFEDIHVGQWLGWEFLDDRDSDELKRYRFVSEGDRIYEAIASYPPGQEELARQFLASFTLKKPWRSTTAFLAAPPAPEPPTEPFQRSEPKLDCQGEACGPECDRGSSTACLALGRWVFQTDKPRGIALFRRACEAGDGRGCAAAAREIVTGNGVPLEPALAIRLYEEGCHLGDGNTCTEAGRLFFDGRSLPKDDVRAALFFNRGCQLSSYWACSAAGEMARYGTGTPKDAAKAAALYEVGCAGGEPTGCLNLGEVLHEGAGTKKNEARAATLFSSVCLKDWSQCHAAGVMAAKGLGGPKDLAKAEALLSHACKSWDPRSCLSLEALRASRVDRIPDDEPKALKAYEKECKAGRPGDCGAVGYIYEVGAGVPRDFARAATSYATACEGGITVACNRLAVFHLYGEGFERDATKAVPLLQKSCDAKDGSGCRTLSDLYRLGAQGVPKNAETAQALLVQGCKDGDEGSCAQAGQAPVQPASAPAGAAPPPPPPPPPPAPAFIERGDAYDAVMARLKGFAGKKTPNGDSLVVEYKAPALLLYPDAGGVCRLTFDAGQLEQCEGCARNRFRCSASP